MRAERFQKIINDPQVLQKEDLAELQQLTVDFPYFHAAHILLSMAAKKWDTSIYQKSLKRTAIIAPNRARLFDLIQGMDALPVERADESARQEPKSEPVIEAGHELDILKAAELSAESAEAVESAREAEKRQKSGEQSLAEEIVKQVVTSFVQKEILKTPDVHKKDLFQEQPESFGDWLSFLKKNNGQSYGEIEKEVNREKARQTSEKDQKIEDPGPVSAKKEKQKAIIDKIIEASPGHIRYKEEQKFYVPEIKAKESLLENEHLVTETLARIYALQGSIGKAVRAYEILSLKYPQKSAYFASLIQKIKTNQKE
jgi:hypothetical protein